MVDAATSLMTSTYGMRAAGVHSGPRGTNMLDSGSPYYEVYECADGKFVTIAAIEMKFRNELFQRLGMAPEWLARSEDRNAWPQLREALAARLASRPRAHWCELLEGSDACFAPVLSMEEAMQHPHQRARRGFIDLGGVSQPAPAPRFGRTPAAPPAPPEAPGESADLAMREWGFDDSQIEVLRRNGALLQRIEKAPT